MDSRTGRGSAAVDNKWFPLIQGTNFDGGIRGRREWRHPPAQDRDDGDRSDSKRINGVSSVIVVDRDFDDRELQESELAFMALDEDQRGPGVGEYPRNTSTESSMLD